MRCVSFGVMFSRPSEPRSAGSQLFQKSLAIFEETGNKSRKALLLHNIGITCASSSSKLREGIGVLQQKSGD